MCLPRVYLSAYHEALAISNNGRVVGRFAAGIGTPAGVFMWTTATGTVDLHAPPGSPYFMDVNDAGDVVVTIVPPLGGTSIPYLYRSGTWININTLLPAGAEVILKSVTGINSAGWMVGDAAPITNPTAGGGIGWLLIPPAPTTTSVNPTPSPSSFGAMVTFTATVQSGGAPVPTGTMTFSEGATVLAGPMGVNASGQAAFSSAALAVGSHTVTAAFSGAPGFEASSASVTHTVNAASPTSQNDAYSTSFETTLDIPAAGVLSNDSNGGAAMTAALQTNVAHGELSLGSDGGFTYSPNKGFVGTDSFTYLASNSVGPGNTATVAIAVANPTTVQPPTGLYVSAIRGNEVTFRWNPPAIGPAPEQFVLTGGLLPGQALATISTGSAYPIFTVTTPDGAYYVRMQSFAAGVASAPSNEIRLFVNTPTPPSAPADLVGLVNGSTMGLAWRRTYAGARALVDAAGHHRVSQHHAADRPRRQFHVRSGARRDVHADGARPERGYHRSAIPTRHLTFPGDCSGAPLPPARFLAYRAGTTIFAVWDSAASGPAPSGFVLHVTGSFVGDIPTAARSLSGAVGPGSYGLSVRATNACGSSAPTTVQTVMVPSITAVDPNALTSIVTPARRRRSTSTVPDRLPASTHLLVGRHPATRRAAMRAQEPTRTETSPSRGCQDHLDTKSCRAPACRPPRCRATRR